LNRPLEKLIGGSTLGFRAPVTDPSDDSIAARPSGVIFRDTFLPIAVDYDSKARGVVTDE